MPVEVKPGSKVQMPVVGCSFLMSMKWAPDESYAQKSGIMLHKHFTRACDLPLTLSAHTQSCADCAAKPSSECQTKSGQM